MGRKQSKRNEERAGIESETSTSPLSPLRGLMIFLVLVFGSYAPATTAGFIWDDDDYVTENPTLETLGGLGRIWFEIGATPQYYPLVHSTFWLEYRLWGESATGYHFVNMVLHALAAFLLWRILFKLRVQGAFFAALFFAVHPIEVESVAWVTERKNVLSGLCYFGSALIYLRFAGLAGEEQRKPRTWAFAFTLFLGALLSKTVTASLPAALLLVTWWKRGRIARRDVTPLLPFFIVGIASGLLTAWMEKTHVGAEGEAWSLSAVEHILLASRIAWFYAGKLLWPSPLVFIYPRWTIDAASPLQYAYPIAALLLIGGLWSFRSRIGRGPLTAILFYGGTLVPALGFIAVYPMRFSYVADHFQYLAGIGPIVLLAAGLSRGLGLDKQWSSKRLVPALALVLLLSALTWRQCRVYRDLETLWRDTIAKNESAWIAHNNLGNVLLEQGELEEAVASFERAIELNPDYSDAFNNLANTLMEAERYEEAVTYYRTALENAPKQPPIHVNLGSALEKLGRLSEAREYADRAVEYAPDWAAAYALRGRIAMRQRRAQDALYDFDKVLALDDRNAEAYTSKGVLLASTGRVEEAIEHFESAVEIAPTSLEALGGLGLGLARTQRPNEAIEVWRKALITTPGNVDLRVMLADLLLQTGKQEEARAEYEKVLEQVPNHPRASQALGR